jgi:ATP-dependent DNA ligase
VKLPIMPPFAPMEAQLVAQIPTGKKWLFEPKWDGFRCIIFRDGNEVELQSKAGKPLGRYFPELVENILRVEAKSFVLDGEIVVPVAGLFSFDDLLQRIHPAASRVNRLAREYPATLIVFDLLVDSDRSSIAHQPLSSRREALERFAGEQLKGRPGFTLSEATSNRKAALDWLDSSSINLDGVMAKRLDMVYRSGDRTGMQKIKKMRTADCVVGGFRYSASSYVGGELAAGRNQRQVGSLLLGLYDGDGLLHHVGFCSSLTERERRALVTELEPLIEPPGFTGNAPGGPSRWSTERSDDWHPLAPKLVVEVRWDHFTGGRFRHGTKLLRWRPDKPHGQCTLDQIEKTSPARAESHPEGRF